jgi:transcriptional regulator GlxA family with amidase domain
LARTLGAAGVRCANDISLERIVRVQRWIDAHLDQDITLDRLCAVAGIGPRALQRSLLAARGQSPHELVTSRRLAVARRLLESGSSRVVVSKVALDCGFSHLGRFAAAYRRIYGESPSETARLRRRSDRAG